jgi:hypothetical protein
MPKGRNKELNSFVENMIKTPRLIICTGWIEVSV